jgi:hypothetical protein
VLSVAYQASVVLVEEQITPKPALPVRLSNVYIVPIQRPRVDAIVNEDGDGEPITAGSTIVVRGERLRGDDTRLRVGDALVQPPAEDVDPTQISAELGTPLFASGDFRAGVQGAQVVHLLDIGTPGAAHRGFESNVAAFVLHPTVTSTIVSDVTGTWTAPRNATITVVADPPIGKDQRVVLLLDRATGPEAYSFQVPTRKLPADPVEVRVEGVAKGDYLVRLQVDGAESLLTTETTPGPNLGKFNGPTLTIP